MRRALSPVLAVLTAAVASPAMAADNPIGAPLPVHGFRDVVIEVDSSVADIVSPDDAYADGYRILYVNRCEGGETIYRGYNDSRTNSSSIIDQTRTFSPFPYGDGAWNQVMSNVRDILTPFGIEVTDVDPGNVPHTEIIVCGNSFLGYGVLGVAPFGCGMVQNAIGYAFAEDHGNSPRYIAETIVHEAGHTWTLNHLYECEDPMTYLTGCGNKYFQNQALHCAEVNGSGQWVTAQCGCGGTTQNSYQTLISIFGPRDVAPPDVSITAPKNGSSVKPGFAVRADAESTIEVVEASFYLDGKLMSTVTSPPWVFNGPEDLSNGAHEVRVEASDRFGNTGSDTVSVLRGEPCQCGDDEVCIDGFCILGPDEPGGLGSSCTGNESCDTDLCGMVSETEGICTARCEPDSSGCPDGFDCIESGAGGVCWPDPDASGDAEGGCGCRATGARGSAGSLLVFALVLLGLRRRRARR